MYVCIFCLYRCARPVARRSAALRGRRLSHGGSHRGGGVIPTSGASLCFRVCTISVSSSVTDGEEKRNANGTLAGGPARSPRSGVCTSRSQPSRVVARVPWPLRVVGRRSLETVESPPGRAHIIHVHVFGLRSFGLRSCPGAAVRFPFSSAVSSSPALECAPHHCSEHFASSAGPRSSRRRDRRRETRPSTLEASSASRGCPRRT